MIWLTTFFLSVVIVLAQVSLASSCTILDGAPHLVALTVACFACRAQRAQAVFLGVTAGLLLDVLSLDALLVNTSALACVAFLVGALRREALLERSAMRGLVTVLAMIGFYAARYLLVRLLDGVWLDLESLARSLAVTLVYAWPVFSVYSGFREWLVLEPRRAAHRL